MSSVMRGTASSEMYVVLIAALSVLWCGAVVWRVGRTV